jgi:hypothetical protein
MGQLQEKDEIDAGDAVDFLPSKLWLSHDILPWQF